MKNTILILLISLFIIIYSCGTGPWITNRKLFNLYKQPILKGVDTIPFKANGIYVSISGTKNPRNCCVEAYVFYDNGYSINFSIDKNFWKNPGKILDQLKSNPQEFSIFSIVKDSLFIDEFVSNPNDYLRSVCKTKGKILNDSIIQIYSKIYLNSKVEIYDEPIILKLYPSYKKSEYNLNSWYLKKKWYREGLHESRK